MKRAVIAGGGTGGHFYPGYVLGKSLKNRGWEVLFLIRKGDPAAARLSQEDIPFVELDIRGMPRSLFKNWGSFLYSLYSGLRTAYRVLRSFRPRVAIGTGGHVSFPVAVSAWKLRIPCLLHESNAQMGLANLSCLAFINVVAMGLPFAKYPRWPSRVRYRLCGTPIRPEFFSLPTAQEARKSLGLDPDKITILVFGGSQGALGINRGIPSAILELMRKHPQRLQCLHLSGTAEEKNVKERYQGQAKVLPYLQEMHSAYAAADLVISRSGAGTLAELIATRKPAALIPLPTSAAGHQYTNARVLTEAGAAIEILERELSGKTVASKLEDLIFSKEGEATKLQAMAKRFDALRLPAPQESIALLVQEVENLAELKKEIPKI